MNMEGKKGEREMGELSTKTSNNFLVRAEAIPSSRAYKIYVVNCQHQNKSGVREERHRNDRLMRLSKKGHHRRASRRDFILQQDHKQNQNLMINCRVRLGTNKFSHDF